ncbi:MAG: hypothetical protein ACK587_04395 [Cyanobacteriota bacterium]|jgi:hypothetical protein
MPKVGAAVLLSSGAALLVLSAAPRVAASSPEAWRAYDREVRTACLKASGLLQPRVMGDRVDVPAAPPDPNGITLIISALLLEGRYPQAHMKGQTGRELCLFDQRTRKAFVGPAGMLTLSRPKP